MGPVEVVRAIIQQTLNLAIIPTHHKITMEPIPSQNCTQGKRSLTTIYLFFQKRKKKCKEKTFQVKKKIDANQRRTLTPYNRCMNKPMSLQPQSVHL